jgi:succinyl-CoA synthetase beta subunit
VDLFEYQGKQLLARFGVPVSPGEAVETVDDAVAAAGRLGFPVVVKAQVQVGGRGKAGGIKLANSLDEARQHASNILGMDIKGHVVRTLWIEQASDITEEYYASFTLDRAAKKHLGMMSACGFNRPQADTQCPLRGACKPRVRTTKSRKPLRPRDTEIS